ncbi:MAG: flagellar basal body rod protein FlgC [Bdellovibrionales bacterium]|nr:flagellar basal body rod protein FlgC [Bdellovibrionales bacterium]
MDVFKTMDVIGSGLTAERTRLNAISSNVANANSTRSADGKGPYRRKDVVLESAPLQSEFGEVLEEKNTHDEVRVVDVKEDQNPGRPVYNPSHVDADAEGYVYMPNVNPVEEMANLISADRAYQTNVSVFQTTKQMAMKALELGR